MDDKGEKLGASSSGGKRPRPVWNSSKNKNVKPAPASAPDAVASSSSGSSQEKEEPDRSVLTPHTRRLLRLIQDGSTEHAQMAAKYLTALTAQSSPLVLWDILGRLQFFLTARDWRTRHNASLAMQGVAQHLPPLDQQHFLQGSHELGAKNNLWLTLSDLSGKIDVILEKGRLLLASSGTKFNEEEEEELQKFDIDSKGREDFCAHRIRLQREILAQRLGLSGVLQAVSGPDASLSAITSDDLMPQMKRQKHIERMSKRQDEETENSIRALLVMEIEQHDGSTATSHQNPQSLLATELIYRMFDPAWHVRHGALLGILAVIRAWKAHQSNTSFGVWPQDIMARCICVLALDRFGDYSGASMTESSGGVVAPVREMAGQVLSVVFLMAPQSIQTKALTILFQLSRNNVWEVRQGALVALKYIVVVIKDISERSHEWQKKSLHDICGIAIQRLDDKASDDVQSVAAQVLSNLLSGAETYNKELLETNFLVREASKPLWEALRTVRYVSSCTIDLVCLFSALLCRNCNLLLESLDSASSRSMILQRILAKLVDLLNCEYLTIKRSVLLAIGSIAGPVAVSCRGNSFADEDGESREAVAESFCHVVEKVFELYFQYFSMNEDGYSDRARSEDIVRGRRQAWNMLINAAGDILLNNKAHLRKLEGHLIMRYFGVSIKPNDGNRASLINREESRHQPVSSGQRLQLRLELAEALAAFLAIADYSETSGDQDRRVDLLELSLCAFLESPWISQCEAACFLHQALSSHRDKNKTDDESSMSPALRACVPFLRRMLQSTPFCILVENSQVLAFNPRLIEVSDKSFTRGVEMVRSGVVDGKSAAKSVVALWQESFYSLGLESQDVTAIVTPSLMRINVAITGAIISGGSYYLPDKLTPLVRALITSVKNEVDGPCQLPTRSSLAKLLQLLCQIGVDPDKATAFGRTREKILNNICDMICSGANPSSSTSSLVVESLVRSLTSAQTLEVLAPVWNRLKPLVSSDGSFSDEVAVLKALHLLRAVVGALQRGKEVTLRTVNVFLDPLWHLACKEYSTPVRNLSSEIAKLLCAVDVQLALQKSLPIMTHFLEDREQDSYRLRACQLLQSIVDVVGMEVCPFVRSLLPLAMSLMTAQEEGCANIATNIFASLVRVAPLVRKSISISSASPSENHASSVIDHLIHGEPLPPCRIPEAITEALKKSGTSLREYQMEGVSWLRFLQTVNLNGALCDSMGLGKTLQALLGIALSHGDDKERGNEESISLVVCPSTVVGHWMREIERFFPDRTIFRALSLTGSASERKVIWNEQVRHCNLVVTNYSVLRSDIGTLSTKVWRFCVLDEGHLLKNPKTGKFQ
jgi:hypothetical protein